MMDGDEPMYPQLTDSKGGTNREGDFVLGHDTWGGLTKREWLIGMCAQGILAGTSCHDWPRTFDRFANGRKVETMAQWLAVNAIQAADAILEEVNRPAEPQKHDAPNAHVDEVI